jgi:hypothetical protein
MHAAGSVSPANANRITYGDAGHAFPFQHAEAFGRQVLDFISAP